MSKLIGWLMAAVSVVFPGLALAQTTYDYSSSLPATDAAASGLFGLGLMIMFVFWIVGFALWILWLFMLVDLAHRQFPNEGDKTTWALVLGLLSLLGAIIYYFFGRPKGTRPNSHAAANTPPAPAPDLPVSPPPASATPAA